MPTQTIPLAPAAPPEVGQLVRVRDRHWVVTNLLRSSLPADPLADAGRNPSHLVELSSVEDDGFGEELTVFWEVEPGTVVLPKATLPRPEPGAFDEPPAWPPSWTPSARARSPRRMPERCRRRSAAGSRSRTTSSIRWSAPSRCPA